jgi:tRNA(Ile)-lysidine synthase TilS/MesJ
MKKFLKLTTNKNELVENQGRVLSTVSGGQDSIVSFFLLLHLRKKKFFNLEILYCQHFWQTKNFFSCILIYKLTFLFEIPYNIILPQNSFLTENGSRSWRKKNFYRVAKLENILNLTTGQTLTDNLETNFNNLIRGTTPKGVVRAESTVINFKKSNLCFFSNILLKPYFYKKSSRKKEIGCLNRLNKNLKLFSKKSLDVSNQCKLTRFKNDFTFLKKNNSVTLQLNRTTNLKLASQTSKPLNPLVLKLSPCSASFCIYSRSLKIQPIHKKPLSEKTRFTISKLVKFYSFPVLTDTTNFSLKFSRNKIRYTLFPVIRYFFNKKVEFLLNNFSKTLQLEHKILETQVLELFFLLKNQKKLNKKNAYRKQKTLINKNVKTKNFLVQLIAKNSLIGIQRSLIQKIFSQYTDTELTYLQISDIQKMISIKRMY